MRMLPPSHVLASKFQLISPFLSEAGVRRWAAVEADGLGRGGVSAIARATGLSRTTIHSGQGDLKAAKATKAKLAEPAAAKRSRRPGGGRKPLVESNPKLAQALEALVSPHTRGDPMSPLLWTCKSTTRLAGELTKAGHKVSQRTVCRLLSEAGYSLQSVRKTREGSHHQDRDAQFKHLNDKAADHMARGLPVISVDAKKKELVGNFANKGREHQPKGEPIKVNTHDFEDKELGKVAPFGVYDPALNEGWVSVGVDHDTAEFAVASIRCWWREMGQASYPKAKHLMITADCGGSNGYRLHLWKFELQKLADELGLTIAVSHFPPGTSKWNKIEHRMFCHITRNWRGRPLESRQVVVNLIGATTTTKGLRIKAALDLNKYESGIKVSAEQLAALRITRDEFHGEWNYCINPR